MESDEWKLSDAELASSLRMRRHFKIGFAVLWVAFALTCVVLASGNHLSKLINVDQNSTLFWLWPFNKIYLQQFTSSPYHSSEIKWFFTVVSSANLIWLIFLCWKLVFELCRRDVQFPPGKNPVIEQAIIRPLVVACIVLLVFVLMARSGFGAHPVSVFAVSMMQSITVGAIKIVTIQMFALYFLAAVTLEFGGLGLRYVLSKAFGFFLADALGNEIRGAKQAQPAAEAKIDR